MLSTFWGSESCHDHQLLLADLNHEFWATDYVLFEKNQLLCSVLLCSSTLQGYFGGGIDFDLCENEVGSNACLRDLRYNNSCLRSHSGILQLREVRRNNNKLTHTQIQNRHTHTHTHTQDKLRAHAHAHVHSHSCARAHAHVQAQTSTYCFRGRLKATGQTPSLGVTLNKEVQPSRQIQVQRSGNGRLHELALTDFKEIP